MDTMVTAVAASSITAAVGNNAGNPPGTSANAQYSNTGFYLSTRPTGNAVTLLMATLKNDSGANLNAITLTYTYRNRVNPTANEAIPGQRVYYSLDGTTWTPVGNYGPNGVYTDVTITLPIDVTATPWTDTSLMYVIFADDNAAVNNDAANTIDNFAVSLGLPPCPGIASDPANVTITQCAVTSVAFTVGATGAVTSIQWERDSGTGYTNIPGATFATYTLNAVGLGDSGSSFRAIVSGGGVCTPITSGGALLTVNPDTTGPVVVYALSSTNGTNITVLFNEVINVVDPAPIDVTGNYTLVDTNTGSQVNLLTAIPLANGRGYTLETDPLDPTHGYTLSISATKDACVDNPVIDATIPIHSFHSTPLPLNATWRYLDNDVDPGAGWQLNSFDDSSWFSATGVFDAKRNAGGAGVNCRPGNVMSLYFTNIANPTPMNCILLTSPVTLTNLITANFRAHFNYTGNTNATLLEVIRMFDDGGIVSLNGVELLRDGMAAGPAGRGTFSTRTVGDGNQPDNTLFVNTSLLRQGDNVIAVELHQVNITSTDLTMGLELRAHTLEALASPSTLVITYNGTDITITWSGGGRLQRSTDLSSPANWADVGGSPSSPYTTAATGGPAFYRVANP